VTRDALLDRLVNLGARGDDDDERRVRKRLLVACVLMILPPAVVWGAVYAAFGEPVAGAIPLGYVAVSLAVLAVYARTGSLDLFRRSQLLLMLVLPMALQTVLGGFRLGSAVSIWSVVSPFGALVFSGISSASRWLAAYLVLLVASALYGTTLRSTNNLPAWLVDGFFLLNIGALSIITFVLLAAFVTQLRRERERSDALLLNILPPPIAARLRAGEQRIADSHPSATILFADVVDFTPLSVSLPPREMLALLDEAFSHFDDLAMKHGVEKIRTIGDNYMAVAGAPMPCADHAERAARLALDMLAYCARNGALTFRIGLNSGPLVGGVIGKRKFVYDVWGDPVNTASRMESHGVPGMIQIGEATYELLKERFFCEPRGTLEVKGKGTLRTWFLRGERPAAVAVTATSTRAR
jgi:guanylate cyclase